MRDESKVAVVTGAGSGIGRAVTISLVEQGYRVALAGRRESVLRETIEPVPDAEDRTLVMAADVADPAAVTQLFEAVREAWDRVDLLFNNAGIQGPTAPVDDVSFEDWEAVVATNLTGAFLCAQAAFRVMRAQAPSGGRIINNGSISAHIPRPQAIAYTATKHAITGLTRGLSLEGRMFNIACGQIDIGNAATERMHWVNEGALQADGSMKIEPQMDVRIAADAVLYMASLPLDANVQFLTVMATTMPYVGRG